MAKGMVHLPYEGKLRRLGGGGTEKCMAKAYRAPQGSGHSKGRAAVHQIPWREEERALRERRSRSAKARQKHGGFMQQAMVAWSWRPWEATEVDSTSRSRASLGGFLESRSLHRQYQV